MVGLVEREAGSGRERSQLGAFGLGDAAGCPGQGMPTRSEQLERDSERLVDLEGPSIGGEQGGAGTLGAQADDRVVDGPSGSAEACEASYEVALVRH